MQFINNLRGIAILTIVLGHALSTVPNPTPTLRLLDFVLGNGTLILVAIAGYLFAETANGFKYGPYLLNKLKSVVAPYLFTSIPAISLYIFDLKTTHPWLDMQWFREDLNVVEQIAVMLVTGAHLAPLWFVPMVVLFYLAAPIFVFIRRRKLEAPAFVLTLAAGYGMGFPPFHQNVLQCFVYYLPFYVFGMVFQTYPDVYRRWSRYSTLLVPVYAVALVAVYFIFEQNSEVSTSITLLAMVPLLWVGMGLFWRHVNRRNRWLDMFARLSFYIFFVHGYFIGVARALSGHIPMPIGVPVVVPQLFMTAMVFAVVVLLCLGLFVPTKLLLQQRSRFFVAA